MSNVATYTGLSEIDRDIGALQKSTSVLLAGGPGSGKTVLALQMVANSITLLKENVVFFSTKENVQRIKEYMHLFGMPVQNWLDIGALYLEEIRPVDVKQMVKNESIRVFEIINAYKAKKVFVDSMNFILESFSTKYEEMTYTLKIIKDFTKNGVVLIGTYDIIPEDYGKNILEYLTDVNFIIEVETRENRTARKIKILKARGMNPAKWEWNFNIENNSVKIIGSGDQFVKKNPA